jgi:hypothetical protein
MVKRRVETAVSQTVDRHFGPEVFARVARQLEASGCVDQMLMWDQLVSWIAPCLWTPENAPLAKYVPDLDSYPDWNVMCGYAAGLAPNLGTVISPAALRIPPA